MVVDNEDPKETAFTVSVDVKAGTSTGISGADRAATFRALADPTSQPSDFNRPGHVFPLRPREGGVRVRDGHTEAAIDFCRLAGLQPAGVLAEICNDDGTMARTPQLIEFCEEHGLVLTSIADLIKYMDEIDGVTVASEGDSLEVADGTFQSVKTAVAGLDAPKTATACAPVRRE